MTIKALRKSLRSALGARNYRITRDGEIHGYGPNPNASHIHSWYFIGWLDDAINA